MSSDSCGPTVTIRTRLEKFSGDKQPGQEPEDIVETEETMPLSAFIAMLEAGSQQPTGD